jgi:hypothetical protein
MTEAELIQIIKQAAKDEVTELDLSNNQISSLPPKGLREGWEPRLFRARGKAYPCGFNRFQYSQP